MTPFRATAAAQVLIVVTGGLVRITGSGLGCPSWPRCAPDALVPPSGDVRMWIEFSNRLVATAVGVLCLWSLVTVVRRRGPVLLAVLQLLGVLAQAVIGGISVRANLAPLVVSAHLACSAALVYLSITLALRCSPSPAPSLSLPALRPAARPAVRPAFARVFGRVFGRAFGRLDGGGDARWVGGVGSVVLVVGLTVAGSGTLVTATGPYAGDPSAARLDVDGELLTRVHASAALTLLLLAAPAAWLLVRHGAPVRVRGVLVLIVGLLLSQLAVGTAQVALDRPAGLVAVHLLLAASLLAALSYLHVRTRPEAGVVR